MKEAKRNEKDAKRIEKEAEKQKRKAMRALKHSPHSVELWCVDGHMQAVV